MPSTSNHSLQSVPEQDVEPVDRLAPPRDGCLPHRTCRRGLGIEASEACQPEIRQLTMHRNCSTAARPRAPELAASRSHQDSIDKLGDSVFSSVIPSGGTWPLQAEQRSLPAGATVAFAWGDRCLPVVSARHCEPLPPTASCSACHKLHRIMLLTPESKKNHRWLAGVCWLLGPRRCGCVPEGAEPESEPGQTLTHPWPGSMRDWNGCFVRRRGFQVWSGETPGLLLLGLRSWDPGRRACRQD